MAWPFKLSKRSADLSDVAQTSIPKVARKAGPITIRARRSFDAGETDRLTASWTTTPLTADQVIDRNQRVLVARSRDQAGRNDYMKAFLRLCDQNIVGHRGVILQAQARDENGALDRLANEAIEVWWRQWQRAENCDITGRRSFRMICKTAVRTAAKDGEFMIREVRGRSTAMGYALQTVDPQRCPVDYNLDRMPGGRFVRQGIEYSREGRPLAYYFMTSKPEHTGYTFNGSGLDRVPADEIIHGFIEDIEGQRRGLPWAATSLWRMHQLSGFE